MKDKTKREKPAARDISDNHVSWSPLRDIGCNVWAGERLADREGNAAPQLPNIRKRRRTPIGARFRNEHFGRQGRFESREGERREREFFCRHNFFVGFDSWAFGWWPWWAGLEKDEIRTSCLGFGDGYNENIVAAMSKVGQGQLHDADSPEKFPVILADELDGCRKLPSKNLRLWIQPKLFCNALKQYGDYPQVQLPDQRT